MIKKKTTKPIKPIKPNKSNKSIKPTKTTKTTGNKAANKAGKKAVKDLRVKKQAKFLGKKFAARHQAREMALQFLYALEMRPGQDFDAALEMFLSSGDVNFDPYFDREQPQIQELQEQKNEYVSDPQVMEMCRELVQGVRDHSDEIDFLLLQSLIGWSPDRIFSLDRIVLRLITFESCVKKTLPFKAAMTEAANLADCFGTKYSARFVNGVLGRIMSSTSDSKPEPEPELNQNQDQDSR